MCMLYLLQKPPVDIAYLLFMHFMKHSTDIAHANILRKFTDSTLLFKPAAPAVPVSWCECNLTEVVLWSEWSFQHFVECSHPLVPFIQTGC